MSVWAGLESHVWLTINDSSKVQGIYNNVEQVDEEFIQAWVDNNYGDTYKCRCKEEGAKLKPLNSNVIETYEASEDYEEERTGDYTQLLNFINFIQYSDDDTFKNEIKDWNHHQHHGDVRNDKNFGLSI